MNTAEYQHKLEQLDAEILAKNSKRPKASTRPVPVASLSRSAPDQAQALRKASPEPTALRPATSAPIGGLEPWADGMDLEALPMEWPQPVALPEALPAVPAFDPDLLPEAVRPWVLDIAHRMQCPADFPAVGALVALSSLVGARAVMSPKARDDWRVVPNLWGAVVGRPAVMKSPALSQAMAPLDRLQAAELEHWKSAYADWEVDQKVADMAADANEKKAKALASKDPAAARALLQPVDAPPAPQARRFVVNDATVEKLGELLQGNEWGFLAYRDEVYGLLKSLDKEGQEGARSFYLQAYDGNQGYTFDRIGRGTTHVPRVCLSLLGSIQPGKVQEYVRGAVAGGSGDDGLLQRFGLAVWPDVGREFRYVDQWPNTQAKQAAWAVYERFAALQPQSDTEPVVWRFSAEAQDLFSAWMEASKTELRSTDMHPALVSHLDKYSKLVPALALLFALVDTPDSGHTVREAELLRALAWAEFLQAHAQRLYSAAINPETTAAVALLGKIRAGKLLDADGAILQAFTARQVAVRGWGSLTTPDAVRKAANLLVDYGWLAMGVVRSGPTGGRPSEVFSINPAAFSGGAA